MPSRRRRQVAFLPALLAGACLSLLPSAASAGLSYFLVAERPGQATHGDSYVVGIDGPADVAHARDLIARGPEAAEAPIVFAEIAKGNPGGVNRNLTAPGQPTWDWHVTRFEGFGDIGIELTDGWPTFVGQDVDGWIQNTNGHVGFWSYTVVRELPNYPASRPPAVPLPPGAWAGGAVMIGMAGWRWRAARRAAAEV